MASRNAWPAAQFARPLAREQQRQAELAPLLGNPLEHSGDNSATVPDDPFIQLCRVFASWNSPRAITYRKYHCKGVADLLGHSSVAITGDVYGHTSDNAARAAIDDLSVALGL